ncbi:MAG: SURF1 family protein [Pacificimonas sp.]|jgi:cytochrome oxidase assembly protein ShyY1|nr:SURF1 family protein [Pacificimonas sp.]
MTRLPVVPTIMVLIAVPVMIALGFWQLDRLDWKRETLADLAQRPSAERLDLDAEGVAPDNFRRAQITCRTSGRPVALSGRSLNGQSGFSYRLPCASPDSGVPVLLDVGWAPRPDAVEAVVLRDTYQGLLIDRFREVGDGPDRFLLVSSRAATPALMPSAPPTIDDIPNSHLSYAGQWFGFAAVLSVIYVLFTLQWRKSRRPSEPTNA